MTFRFLLSLSLLGILLGTQAQTNYDEVLMTIADSDITVREFISIYQKNNIQNQPIDQQSLNEYLDLFINFKLKVREAEDMGLDTVSSFITELAGYREQLAKPYFMDKATIDQLVQEAYDRSTIDIRASHIFLRLNPDALPADTMVALQKIKEIRERLISGENFEEIAIELSEDPSARDRQANSQRPFIKGNKGDLGYFTVFDMVYPFETAAFTLEVAEISEPVHTDYGYHLIKVYQKQPAMGKVTVAHLYQAIPKGSSAEDSLNKALKIDSIYAMLQNGADWDSLVLLYSDDKGSSSRGGILPKFGVNRMVPEFIEAIYNLDEIEDYTQPVLTSYGWHIIKLKERDAKPDFEQIKGDLKQKVIKDSRSQAGRQVVIDKIIDEYGLKQYITEKQAFYPIVTDSIFKGKWNVVMAEGLEKPLFMINDQVTSQKEFAEYLAKNQKKQAKQNIQSFVNKQYKDFLHETLLMYENMHLEEKYPEFKALMSEYRDGILLFDLTDKNVWSKAVKDTTGLKDFYEEHKSEYMWGPRVDASIYTLKNPKAATAVRSFISTGLSDEDILKEINSDDEQILTIQGGKFSRKDNLYIEKVTWEVGVSREFTTDIGVVFVNIREVLNPEPKQLNEARGLITADYQNFLEKAWIKELKKTYPIVVNKEVYNKIK